MNFIKPDLDLVLNCLKQLKENETPLWGNMSPIGMIEHLSDSLNMASGNPMEKIEVPEKYWNKMIEILNSDVEFPKNFKASFAPENRVIRNSTINDAIYELKSVWKNYEEVFSMNPKLITNHPNYGPLNKKQWDRILSKHLTHHFKQFSITHD